MTTDELAARRAAKEAARTAPDRCPMWPTCKKPIGLHTYPEDSACLTAALGREYHPPKEGA